MADQNLGDKKKIRNEAVRRECDLELITDVLLERRLRWLGHVLRRPDTELTARALRAQPLPGWRRRRGGQVKTWVDAYQERCGDHVRASCAWS